MVGYTSGYKVEGVCSIGYRMYHTGGLQVVLYWISEEVEYQVSENGTVSVRLFWNSPKKPGVPVRRRATARARPRALAAARTSRHRALAPSPRTDAGATSSQV